MDEWDVFGSDDDDSEEETDICQNGTDQADEKGNTKKDSMAPLLTSAIEKAVDKSVLQTTQQFLRSSRSINITKRVFGAIEGDQGGSAQQKDTNNDDRDSQTHTKRIALLDSCHKAWGDVFTTRLSQRGVKLFQYNYESEKAGSLQFMTDAAALFRTFYTQVSSSETSLIHDNVDEEKSHISKYESKLRKTLVPGGFLILNMCILSRPDSKDDSSDIHDWTPQQLLSQWKVSSGSESPIFSEAVWDVEHAEIIYSETCSLHEIDLNPDGNKDANMTFSSISLMKRNCTVNTKSCKWKGTGANKYVPSSFCDNKMDGLANQHDESKRETWLQYERRILQDATISRTIAEHNAQQTQVSSSATVPNITDPCLTPENIQKAVKSIQTHGFVIIPSLFNTALVKSWSEAVLTDFQFACDILRCKQNVDILNPGKEGNSDPVSYREMAMREDLRVDLRDGPKMRQLRIIENERCDKIMDSLDYVRLGGGDGTTPTIVTKHYDEHIENQSQQQCEEHKLEQESLRFHPAVLKIIETLSNPHDTSSENHTNNNPPLFRGNFGRWNFSGSGPNGKPQPVRVGQVGSVVSVPGSADQAIHADTSHLFETHDCLPCHYANVFTMGCPSSGNCTDNDVQGVQDFDTDGNFSGGNLVGGTAFVHGSHRLSVTARLTTEDDQNTDDSMNVSSISAAKKNAQDEMHMRVIRPSLQLGDVLIFDCRTLHFGLSNQSGSCSSSSDDEQSNTGLRRPLLYINMTQSWFNDPKNWDDRQSIFFD